MLKAKYKIIKQKIMQKASQKFCEAFCYSLTVSTSVLTEVVPTATMFLPASFASLMILADSSEISNHSESILWSKIFSHLTGLKVPKPTFNVTKQCCVPFCSNLSNISFVLQ